MRSLLISIVIVAMIVLAGWFYLYPDEFSNIDPERDSTASANPSPAAQSNESVTQEAEKYIEQITDQDRQSIEMAKADDFVTKDQSISLADEKEIETLSLSELERSNFNSKAPITVVQTQQQIVHKTPSDILLDAKGDKNQTVQYLEGNELIESTIGELLNKYPLDTIENIAVIKNVENYVITTIDELKTQSDIDKDAPLKIIKQPYRETTTSIGELLPTDDPISNDDIFYVRNISESDQAGIWGIVQEGLLQNFAKGIAIKRGENYEKYQIDIPKEADEKLADQTSSFLGKLIFDKSQKSYVYNFEKGKMGRNPDLIYPGSEIVIIQFTQDELIEIYKHFITKSKT